MKEELIEKYIDWQLDVYDNIDMSYFLDACYNEGLTEEEIAEIEKIGWERIKSS